MEIRYNNFEKDSNFNKLAGHYKRGIEEQVYIELEAYKMSKFFGKKYENKEECQKLFNQLCEKYAKDEMKTKELFIKSSKRLYLFPLERDRKEHYLAEIKEQARIIDTKAKYMLDNSRNR